MFEFSALPESAHLQYENFQETLGREFESPHSDFLRIFGNSEYLVRRLIRFPNIYKSWLQDRYRRSEKPLRIFKDEITQSLLTAFSAADALPILKDYKYREMLRLTLRELWGDNPVEIYREFSHLALSLIESATEILFKENLKRYGLSERTVGDFALIAMGKLGGFELNYSSDIDLILIYEEDKKHETISNQEFFSKFAQKFGPLFSTPDEHGFLYRVDWDLRPEGKSGTLANSLQAMESYYEIFGAEWERQAFIKAEIAFQKQDTGHRFLQMMTPFVYRKYFDQGTIERAKNIRERMITEQKDAGHGFNVKIGAGGIRDIEFLVQVLQLLHGGKVPQIRTPNTLEGLKVLEFFGFISHGDHQILETAYLFLRRVESCLQMENEQQIHIVRDSPEDHLKLARRFGYTQSAEHAIEIFKNDLKQHRQQVRNVFHSFFGEAS